MRALKIVLSLYIIGAAGFVVISSILSIGEPLQPPTTLDVLITILLTIPLFILGVIVIRFNGGRKNKEVVSTDLEGPKKKVENAAKRIESIEEEIKVIETEEQVNDRLSVPAGNKNDRQRAYEFIKREIVSLLGPIEQDVDEMAALHAAFDCKLEIGDMLRGLKDGILDPTPKLIEAFKSLVGPKVNESQIDDFLIRPFLSNS